MKRIVFSRGRVAAALAIVAALILLLIVVLIVHPGSIERRLDIGNAHMLFSADRQLVLTPG